MNYPHAPAEGKTDTSREAAKKIKIAWRDYVLGTIRGAGPPGATTSEIAETLRHDYSGIQPRTSELKALGFIRDSGMRRKNAKGNNEIVWWAT